MDRDEGAWASAARSIAGTKLTQSFIQVYPHILVYPMMLFWPYLTETVRGARASGGLAER